jgi:hypothetical protein
MSSITRRMSPRSVGVGLTLAATLIVTIYGFTSAQATGPNASQAVGVLTHAPRGTAALLWSQTSQTLVVTVVLSGLTPNSIHPDAIHNGVGGGCTSSIHGAVAHGLNPVNADSAGNGTSVTTISDVSQGIPGAGWYIDVHNGPYLADSTQQERIACADIINPNALIPEPTATSNSSIVTDETTNNESLTHGIISDQSVSNNPTTDQVVDVTFGGSADDDQSIAVGAVELSITHHHHEDRLTVKIFVYPLTPGSTHVAHIHSGSCESQGPVLYPLSSVQVNSVGFGTSTTEVDGVSSIPSTGWYVNVHRASPQDSLASQTNFDPIACVDISTSDSISLPSPTPTPIITPAPFIE